MFSPNLPSLALSLLSRRSNKQGTCATAENRFCTIAFGRVHVIRPSSPSRNAPVTVLGPGDTFGGFPDDFDLGGQMHFVAADSGATILSVPREEYAKFGTICPELMEAHKAVCRKRYGGV